MEKRQEDGLGCDSDDDEDDLDLTLATNYNTISSLAALKELLHGTNSDDSDDDTAWFQHYFLHHVNRLPKQELRSPYLRPIIEGRRLSQCREVPEEEDHEGGGKPVTKVASSSSIEESENERTTTPVPETKRDSPVRVNRFTVRSTTPRRHNSSPVSPQTAVSPSFVAIDPPRMTTRASPLPSPHLDKRFFDESLIEMKSQASSSSTLDSTEDIWVRRTNELADTSRRKKELGSQPLPVISVTDDADGNMASSNEGGGRPRAGTWSISQSRQRQQQQQQQEQHLHVGHGGSAGNNAQDSKQRRKSGDDINLIQNAPASPAASQVSSPSRKPALFDAFRPRSKSDASRSKKPGTIISHMKSAMQHSLMSSSPSSSSRNASPSESNHHNHHNHHNYNHNHVPEQASQSSSGRPRAGSESSGKGPVSKVMDMFRHRSHSALSAEDKRKARAAAHHQQQVAAQSKHNTQIITFVLQVGHRYT